MFQPLPDALASSTTLSVAPSPLSLHLTHALLSRTQSVLDNARPSRSEGCFLIFRLALTTSMPISSVPPYTLKGLTII